MLKRIAKWLGIFLGIVLLLVSGLVAWVQVTWSVDHPDTPLPAIEASTDPEVIAQGEYLVNAVAHCSTCHVSGNQVTSRQFDFDSPLEGGYVINAGPFGVFTAANLTPHATGIGTMSDGEIARVVRYGIDRHGKLSPMMRFALGPMADEDLTAIVSYLRSREPVEAERPGAELGFLAKALSGRFTPRVEEAPEYVPAGGVSVERGRYLAEGPAVCSGCHSPLDPMSGFAPAGPAFSGAGAPEPDEMNPGFEFVAPNLTPDPATGHITAWTEDEFVARFRAGRVIKGSIMPWEAFGRMTEDDVRSIYRFLRTVPSVERNTGPTYRKAGSFKP